MRRRSFLVAAPAAAALVALGASCTTDDPPEGAVRLPDADAVLTTALERLDDGGTVRMADYAGTPLVVNFFATTCAPCVEEMPAFERVKQAIGADVAFLGISTQESRDDGLALVERTGITWDVARDTDGAVLRAAGGIGMPTTLVLDAEGEVVFTRTGQLEDAELADALRDRAGVELPPALAEG